MRNRNVLFLSTISFGWALLLTPRAGWGQDEAVQIDGAAAPVGAVAAGVPKQRLAPEIAPRLVILPETRPINPGQETYDAGSFQPAGYVEAAPEGLTAAPVWQTAAIGGMVYALELQSPKAKALRVRMRGPASQEMELRVYDPTSGSTFGPYSMDGLRNDEDWWTTIIFGDQIGLEFHVSDAEGVAPRLPEINGIAYISVVPDVIGGVSDAQGCTHRDVSCEAAWLDEADAVAMLSVVQANGNVVGFCSGALLNRAPSDLAPVVATANHCLGNQSSANSASYVWLFQTPSCNGAVPNPNNLPRSDGSLLLKRATGADYNLVGLYEDQGGGFFLGWDSAFWSTGSAATGIHHPGGTFKRISFGSKFGEMNQTFCDSNGQNCFDADVWNIDYTTGFTQPGSSGSPVMDSSARVRGTLTGGPAGDCTISRYGRFDLAFPNLRYYLFEMASPSFVNGAVAGDSGNNGSSERGTVLNPFNTVYEASFAVPAGGTLMVTPDSYNERFTIRRAMTIERLGGSGSVVIGQ